MILNLGKTLAVEIAQSAISAFGVQASALTEQEKGIIQELSTSGVTAIRGFYDSNTVQRLRSEIDRLLTEQSAAVWADEQNSDHRLFGADRFSAAIQQYLDHDTIGRIGKAYTHSDMLGRLTLAARLNFQPGNKGSGGGWHRDSPVRHQFKSIVYLTDVGPNNGPFEYLLGSHRSSSILGLVSKDLQQFKQYRFTDQQVEALQIRGNLAKRQCLGNAGDLILVDTKGIHRGAPILAGARYALTNYFWAKEIPEHILGPKATSEYGA